MILLIKIIDQEFIACQPQQRTPALLAFSAGLQVIGLQKHPNRFKHYFHLSCPSVKSPATWFVWSC
jgi:hypothetical protein